MLPAKYALMHAVRPSGGSPSAHIDCKQLLSAPAGPPYCPGGHPGHVSWAPMPGHFPADPWATIAVPSCCAPVSEHVSTLAEARFIGARLFVVRYMLMVSPQVWRSASMSPSTPLLPLA